MIKALYIFFTVVIGVCFIEGMPVLDIFSDGWHTIASGVLKLSAFFAFFLTVFNGLGYIEEGENPDGSFYQFYLRTFVGLRNLAFYPMYLWLGMSAAFIQFNEIGLGLITFILFIAGSSIVLVQNGLYKHYLLQQMKD
jgi:hypothetical protein